MSYFKRSKYKAFTRPMNINNVALQMGTIYLIGSTMVTVVAGMGGGGSIMLTLCEQHIHCEKLE